MNGHTLDGLNAFLRDELAAVETYDVALTLRSSLPDPAEVSECQRSHRTRVAALRDKIVSLGGKAALTSGLKVRWARMVQVGTSGGAGPSAAIHALEMAEDRVLRAYRHWMPELDPEVRVFVERTVLPEEEYTHLSVSELKDRLAAAS